MTELYAEYERQCNREGVVDFAELLLRCYELLSRNEVLAGTISSASRTCWWTSSRTPIVCSICGSIAGGRT
jgi:superfamily I DNA/RNA helicase